MTNPYSTGGGGVHFEATVVASTLVAILCQSPIRGLLGQYATETRTQRAAFNDPLDDLIISGLGADGSQTKLHLQIKKRLTFTENDHEWVDTLQRAWETFSDDGFDPAIMRYGVCIGTYHAKADTHYQAVLSWATQSVNGDHFFERIHKRDFSHQDRGAFVDTVRSILAAHVRRSLSNDEIWRFLKSFVIIHFDFQSGVSSRDTEQVLDRLRSFLPQQDREQAPHIWDHLIAKAGELIPTGGGASRITLVEHLKREGLPTGNAPSLWNDVQAIFRESQRALGDINSKIANLTLHRLETYQKIKGAFEQGRFIQIIGEPGSGKSALLKAVAEEVGRIGPVFVLKDNRIHPRGWSAHAHILNVSADIASLLREFACCSVPILFIDGIDRIIDPAVQLTINDILRALVEKEGLANWRVLVTVREQNLKHIETWLDQTALNKLPLCTVSVGSLNKDELAVVGEEVPRLRPLLARPGNLDVVLSRPFFLEAINRLSTADTSRSLPVTEVELLTLWWTLGGSDRTDFTSAPKRQSTLLDLAQLLVRKPNSAISIRDIPSDPLEELKAAGVIRDKVLGHSVEFTHDIYEEWALCELLIGVQDRIVQFLEEVGQPRVLVRPTQLLGAYVLEATGSTEAWKSLLECTGASSLRPVWQRTILTSCFQSIRTTELLGKLEEDLVQQDGELLRRLLLAISTLEVVPNPLFLNEQLAPGLAVDERVLLANLAALPKPLIWVRFLDWLVPKISTLPSHLVPALLPVLSTWQNNYAGRSIRHCREIGILSYQWLLEIEEAIHPVNWTDRKRPFGPDVHYHDEEKIEKDIRSLFLSSAGDVPELVKAYLNAKGGDKRNKHHFREDIIRNSAALIRHLPKELVDFFLIAFLERPQDQESRRGGYYDDLAEEYGISGHHQFYPASPIQMPFLALLRQNEEQGLRLIRDLCNHSISIWRWSCGRRSYQQPVTPLPVKVKFPWGWQSFWGDNKVYLWFRGYWGNDAVKSALMALEQWAIEQIDGGSEFSEVFQKVIQGIDCVAVLGLGVSLCLAFQEKSTVSSLPLVTCPHLWGWDIARLIGDSMGTSSNEIGNWFQHRMLLSAVRKLNQKEHRKQDIRALTPRLYLTSDKALKRTYLRGIRSFPKRLPIIYKEENSSSEHLAELKERMRLFSEQADPKYLKTAPTDDGKHYQVWIEPPSLQDSKYQAQLKEQVLHSEYSSLAMSASTSLDTGELDERLTVEIAVRKGMEFDDEGLFDTRYDTDNFHESQRASAVSGAALMVAKYCTSADWTGEIATWCLDVLERAATVPEQADSTLYRGSSLMWHPTVFAAYGYAALLERGVEVERCKDAILNLAVDALDEVVRAVFASSRYYASTEPDFLWVLLDLGLRQCVVPRHDIPDHHSPHWDNQEATEKLALLDHAESMLKNPNLVRLPDIPMPWVRLDKPSEHRSHKDTDGFGRNDLLFMFNLAEGILLHGTLDPLLIERDRRSQILRLLDQLVEFTLQEIVPPFAHSRRDNCGGNTPYKWVFEFSNWCGKIFTKLTASECRATLQKIFAQDNEASLLIMQNLMWAFMIEAFLPSKEIRDDHLLIWNEMADWVFENREWKRGGVREHLDREFTGCALSILFCAAPDFGPVVCGIDRGWKHWAKFLPLIERAVREFGLHKELFYAIIVFFKGGAFDLLPDPALSWLKDIVLAKRRDQTFWSSNGEGTVEIIKALVEKDDLVLTSDHLDAISLITDILVDNGVRGAGFFQQEISREGR